MASELLVSLQAGSLGGCVLVSLPGWLCRCQAGSHGGSVFGAAARLVHVVAELLESQPGWFTWRLSFGVAARLVHMAAEFLVSLPGWFTRRNQGTPCAHWGNAMCTSWGTGHLVDVL